jgi:hypothetical protein
MKWDNFDPNFRVGQKKKSRTEKKESVRPLVLVCLSNEAWMS